METEKMAAGPLGVEARARELFEDYHGHMLCRTDRMFAWLMGSQWLFGILLALLVSPRTWAGSASWTHVHVWAAVLLGGLISGFPILLALLLPGRALTRHAIACGQIMTSALLIHLTGGRIETHFHVFGSLAFLAFYRDWKVLLTATLVVALDHGLRGVFWPQSVYGILAVQPWRFLEHAGWVFFEDIILLYSVARGLRELRDLAQKQALLEAAHRGMERQVEERTGQLKESNQMLLTLIQASPVAIMAVDGGGLVTIWNQGAESMFGWNEKEVLGRPLPTVPDAGKEEFNGFLKRVLGGEALRGLELKRRKKDGSQVDVLLSAAPLRDAGGRIYGSIAVAVDMSERKRLERVVLQSEKMSAVGQLAAGVAHEINNPLGVILGFAQALCRRIPEGDEHAAPLKSIEREAVRCRDLVRNLLLFSRQGQGGSLVQEFDLNEAARSSVGLADAQARIHSVKTELRLPGDSLRVVGDRGQIEQVLINLCLNAVDAMPSGGTLTVDAAPRPAGGAVIRVSDTGVGIPEAVRSRIFEPFFTTKEPGKGTGLGLSIVHEIVYKHGGTIECESQEGRGTTFTVSLPATPADRREEACVQS